MALVSDWQDLQAELPEGWVEARIHVGLEHPGDTDRAVALLAPLQPLRPGPDTIAVLSPAAAAPVTARRPSGGRSRASTPSGCTG